jgi:hypothetical protein
MDLTRAKTAPRPVLLLPMLLKWILTTSDFMSCSQPSRMGIATYAWYSLQHRAALDLDYLAGISDLDYSSIPYST